MKINRKHIIMIEDFKLEVTNFHFDTTIKCSTNILLINGERIKIEIEKLFHGNNLVLNKGLTKDYLTDKLKNIICESDKL